MAIKDIRICLSGRPAGCNKLELVINGMQDHNVADRLFGKMLIITL